MNTETTVDLHEAIEATVLPDNLKLGLNNYFVHHTKPGGFLTCVICNDLVGAVMRADPQSMVYMKPLMEFMLNEVPAKSWGSPERLKAWVNE